MANERITEGFVRDHFKDDALFTSIKWEEQRSGIKRVQELLKGESKGKGKGNGYPEFIVSFPTNSNYIIVVECKAQTKDHESENRDDAVRYAVDGALHYAKALSADYNVIAIAVSGQTAAELLVSHFYWKKGDASYSEIGDKKLLSVSDYMQVFKDQFFIADFYTRDIAYKARYLNEEFNNYTIPEYKRCTMISAMLLALLDAHFQETFDEEPTSNMLGQSLLSAINAVFEAEEDMVRSKTVLMKEFESLLNEPIFLNEKIKNKKAKKDEFSLLVLKDFLIYLKKYVYPLIAHANIAYDVLGRFYIEFIRYAASEQKSGLVLTPAHITELFCDLAELTVSDVVYDPCCGTGGFLVAAMQRMFRLAGNDMRLRENIRKRQICGCELRSDIFTYACSSMRFRGDGKSNIYNGSCFHYAKSIADNHRPTVAFLNPPYDVGTAGQMEFVQHALSVLDPRAYGRVVAIVQMSCAIQNNKELKAIKSRILANHHLRAVISMPDDLFYPVGVVTCIMVFEANKPNAGRKTWFGYFKDEGFVKKKPYGRIDAKNRYAEKRQHLLNAYLNNEVIPGFAARKEISEKDEWCAEAYMETAYEAISENDFIKSLRNYAAFLVQNSKPYEALSFSTVPYCEQAKTLDVSKWKWFDYFGTDGLFDIRGSKTTSKDELEEAGEGEYPYVTTQAVNNGVDGFYAIHTEVKEVFTVDSAVLGFCAYQEKEFSASDHVELLIPKFPCNKYIAQFITTLINKEQYRYNYGRKCSQTKLKASKIKLPVDSQGRPDWKWMEDYIKSLPYSQCL